MTTPLNPFGEPLPVDVLRAAREIHSYLPNVLGELASRVGQAMDVEPQSAVEGLLYALICEVGRVATFQEAQRKALEENADRWREVTFLLADTLHKEIPIPGWDKVIRARNFGSN